MENVEKSISRIMADKVYTSAEFKRERDNFHALCKDLERAEVKKWLAHILEILMAERAKDQRKNEFDKLEVLIKKHEELIPTVMKTQVMVDLYWKCYAYGDELNERQEKSLGQLETKRSVVKDLIDKGKKILENPDKPKFLESHVSRIELGWDDTKMKAQERLKLLQDTKEAWVGYAENNDTIVVEIEKGIEEIKKIKKRFALEDAFTDLAKRQDLLNKTRDSIMGLYNQIKHNVEVMGITLPDDKKKIISKEMAALEEKLVVVGQFEEKVKVIEDFCSSLKNFDGSLKSINDWMLLATKELEDIKNSSDKMAPEDRVARTMDLQEDIAAKFEIIKANTAAELELLPQGEKVPEDAQAHKDELNRITKYVSDLQEKVKKECDNFSEDVKFWAEYKTGIKEFAPWLSQAEANALSDKVHSFDKACLDHLKVLETANAAAQKMTTHKEADAEVAAMRERYAKVKAVADEWVKKVDTLVK